MKPTAKQTAFKYALYMLAACMMTGGCKNPDNKNQSVGTNKITVVSDGKVTELDDSNFDHFIKTGFVLVKFGATYCGPCRALSPLYSDIAARHREIKCAEIDIEASKNTAKKYDIHIVPTIVAFIDGKEVGRYGGGNRQELENYIQSSFSGNPGENKSVKTFVGTVRDHSVEEPADTVGYFNTTGHRITITDADGDKYWIYLFDKEYNEKFQYMKPGAKIIVNYREDIPTPEEWKQEAGIQLTPQEIGGPAVPGKSYSKSVCDSMSCGITM